MQKRVATPQSRPSPSNNNSPLAVRSSRSSKANPFLQNSLSGRKLNPQFADTKTDEDFDFADDKGAYDLKMIDMNFNPKVEVGKDDINFDHHINEMSKCNCHVCFEGRRKKKNQIFVGPEAAFFEDFHFESAESSAGIEKDFVFILKRLIPGKNMLNSLRIFIPDTACFIQGECRFLVFTAKDRTLKFIKQRERLTLAELRKYFDERRRKKDEEFTTDDTARKTKDDVFLTSLEPKELSRNESKLDSSSSAPNILRPMKFGAAKGQISEALVSKEAALIRFQDDSATMLTELEFNNIFSKRKIDPIWKNTQYLQNSTRLKKSMHTLTRVYFVYHREKDNPLFKRAHIELRYLTGSITKSSDDYISPADELKFEEELRINNEREYCLYLLCKIHHFLEVVYDIKVFKMGGDFTKDEAGLMWLTNVSRLQYQIIEIGQKGDTPMRSRPGYSGLDEKDDSDDTQQRPYHESERKETVKILNNMLSQHYMNIKKSTGFDVHEVYYEEDLTEDSFNRLHPKAPFGLIDILRKRVCYDDIREFLILDTTKLLYPNKAKSGGKHLDVYSKFTYIGSPPRIMPGMVIKRESAKNSSKSMTKLLKITGNPQGRDDPGSRGSPPRPTTQSLYSNHERLREALGKTFVNTGLNVKPSLRGSFFRPVTPIPISELATRPMKFSQLVTTPSKSPAIHINGDTSIRLKHGLPTALGSLAPSPMNNWWATSSMKDTIFKESKQTFGFEYSISRNPNKKARQSVSVHS